MGSLYLGGPTIQEVDGKMMMGLSIYGVAVISGLLYSRFYGIFLNQAKQSIKLTLPQLTASPTAHSLSHRPQLTASLTLPQLTASPTAHSSLPLLLSHSSLPLLLSHSSLPLPQPTAHCLAHRTIYLHFLVTQGPYI